MEPLEELETLIPEPAVLTLAGEELAITPLTIGRLPRFLRATQPLLASFETFTSGTGELDIYGMVQNHGDTLLDAAAIATGRPRDWVEQLMLDEFIRLVEQIILVNADFFTRRVVPQVRETSLRVTQRQRQGQQQVQRQTAGPTSSTS